MADVGLAVQRAKDKTEQMQARADAIDELTAAGALEDFTSSGDDIDRQLKQIQQSGQVDDELAKLKAELGAPAEPAAVDAAEPAAAIEPAEEPAAADDAPAKPAPRRRAPKKTP